MANKLTLDIDDLDVEYQMLMKELDSMEDLYAESKDRLDIVSRNPTRANPVFMSSQTANLISIKEKRISIIKELTNIKRTKMDLVAKEFNTNNKLEDNETGLSKDVLEIYKLLTGDKTDKTMLMQETIDDENNAPEIEYTDAELDDILNERLSIETDTSNETKKKTQTLPSGYSVVVTEDDQRFIVDGDYNDVTDDFPDFNLSLINIVKYDTVDDTDYAYDDLGNAYEVVQFE